MDVREKSHREHRNGSAGVPGESAAEARLTPPEETKGARNNQGAASGVLAVNTGELKLPKELTEEEEEVKRFMPVDPAVLVILCFSLLFILTIAYVIWSGWEPPR